MINGEARTKPIASTRHRTLSSAAMTTSQGDEFVPGHRLSAALYHGVVAPALAAGLPRLSYAAGLIGHGSDVLGYDTPTSADHDWGPLLQIVVDEAERDAVTPSVLATVEAALPTSILGVPTDLPGSAHLPGDEVHHHNSASGRRHHGVTVTSVDELQRGLLGTGDHPDRWTSSQWLTIPRQSLVEFTAGPVHRDGPGHLTATRAALAWYPHDVWLYVMSARWQRIAQVEAFVGRTAQVGDESGSRLLAAQIVHDAMHLALLQRRVYAPYAKWLGTAFARHEDDEDLTAPLGAALAADTSDSRQDAVVAALLELSRRQDRLGIAPPAGSTAETFFGRPFPVIWCERIARSLHEEITRPDIAALTFGLGGIDEITTSTDALKNIALRHRLGSHY